jgi:hypothetical protein
MAITFDGENQIISLSLGTTTLSVRELWSRWIDWFLTGDNSKYGVWMNQVGGDSIDAIAGTSIPIYIFLDADVKIKPQEANHTLGVTDGILLVAGGGDPFMNTTGAFIVRINYQQPVQAIGFDSGGGGGATAEQVAEAVWEYNAGNFSTYFDDNAQGALEKIHGIIFTADSKIGTPVSLDGGDPTLGGMLTKIADDNGGADFDAAFDSMQKQSAALGVSSFAFIDTDLYNYLEGKIGTPVSLDGGDPTLGGMLTKIADNNGGADFQSDRHSLESIGDGVINQSGYGGTILELLGNAISIDGSNWTMFDLLAKIADDNGGADYDATTDSLHAQAAAGGATKEEIAAAVWDEATSGHITAGTFGAWVQGKLLTVAKFLGLK